VIRRIQEGEVVSFVIVAIGIIGVARVVPGDLPRHHEVRCGFMPAASTIRATRSAVLLAFKGDGKRIENAELAELRSRRPSCMRFEARALLIVPAVGVAAGPLLGLIGTSSA
jgi:hypothetical protein